MTYLYHGDHAVVADGVRADGEVPVWISTDDPVDGVPVRRVRLVGIYHRQISHHKIHSVLRDLTGKLQKSRVNTLFSDAFKYLYCDCRSGLMGSIEPFECGNLYKSAYFSLTFSLYSPSFRVFR